MKQIWIIFLSIILNLQLYSQELSSEQARQDLSVIRKALETRHPELYRFISMAEFNSRYNSIYQSFNQPISVQEFYLAISPLISSIKCGHTKWLFPGKDYYYPFHGQNLFPLKLYFAGNKAFILASYSNAEIPIQAEVLSINGLPTEQLISGLLEKLSFADGNTLTGKYYELNNFFPGIYSTYFGTAENYRILYRDKDGQNKEITVGGVDLESIKCYESAHSKDGVSPFTFSIVEEKTGWMRITRFFAFGKEPNYHRYLKRTFKYLHDNQIENLVIDLRGNEGGNEKWGMELAGYLSDKPFRYYERFSTLPLTKNSLDESISFRYRLMRFFAGKPENINNSWTKTRYPEKYAFQGKIFILIDGQSYSTATEFASKFKSSGKATIVGQESGGGYNLNTSGFFSIVKLPNSKIELGIPLIGFHMGNDTSKNPAERGIIPDFEVETQPADILNSKDKVREFILEKIKK